MEVAATEADVQRCGGGSNANGGDGVGEEEGRLIVELAVAVVGRVSRASSRSHGELETRVGDGGLLPNLSRWGVFPREKDTGQAEEPFGRGIPNAQLS